MTRKGLLVGAVLAALVGACSTGAETPRAADPAASTAARASAATTLIDVAALPAGKPPRVDYLGGGVLQHRGVSVDTDFRTDLPSPDLLGYVDGRAVVNTYDRFWTIDATGHAQRLGKAYTWYDYSPKLVASTGHLWVQYTDRTSPRTIWEIDARTGDLIAKYGHNRVPRGLAPADQRLVDAWVHRESDVSTFPPTSPDGTLTIRTRSKNLGDGLWASIVIVRQVSDRREVARFGFPGDSLGVQRILFQDDDHLVMLVTVESSRRHGEQQAIVRCSVVDESCERATGVDGTMALGVTRPSFR